jgi:hypothetical protein
MRIMEAIINVGLNVIIVERMILLCGKDTVGWSQFIIFLWQSVVIIIIFSPH